MTTTHVVYPGDDLADAIEGYASREDRAISDIYKKALREYLRNRGELVD